MFSRLWAFLTLIAGVWLIGCGGGNETSISVPVQSTQITTIPGQEISSNLGNLSVNISGSTFTEPANVVLNRYQTPSSYPLPSEFSPINNSELEITSTQEPLSPIQIKPEDSLGNSSWLMISQDSRGQWICLNGFDGQNRGISAGFLIDPVKFAIKDGLATAKGIVGMIRIDPYKSTRFINFLTSGDNAAPQNTALVLIHGWNGSGAKMEPLAQAIANLHLYQFIFIFEYDSRRPCLDVAGDFFSWVNPNDIKTDILAHSMGAAVCRFSLEIFGTDRINNFFSVCGANEGSICYLSGITDFMDFLRNDYLNSRGLHLDGTFPLNVPASAVDLCRDSDFIATLNNPGLPVYNTANYYILRGNTDSVVGVYSAEGSNIDWGKFTTGKVVKKVFSGQNHSSMIDTEAGRSALAEYIKSVKIAE